MANLVTLNTETVLIEVTLLDDEVITIEVATQDIWGGEWNFATNSYAFPISATAGRYYYTTDDHGVPGDNDYVPAGTLMVAKVSGANSFSQYFLK